VSSTSVPPSTLTPNSKPHRRLVEVKSQGDNASESVSDILRTWPYGASCDRSPQLGEALLGLAGIVNWAVW
jgi:hypothetical protein